jgi:hypothetical protein
MKFFKNFKNFLSIFFIDFSLGGPFLEVKSWSKTAFTNERQTEDAWPPIFFFGAFLTYFYDFSIFSKISIFYNFSKKSKKTPIFRNFTDFHWFLLIFSDFLQILVKIHYFSLFLAIFTYFWAIIAKVSKISKKREKMQKV